MSDDINELLNNVAPESSSSFDSNFNYAVDQVRQHASNFDQSNLLYLYGRYKIVMDGPCKSSKPGLFDFKGRQKWDSWKSLGCMDPQQAKEEYVSLVFEKLNIDPNKIDATTPKNKSGFGQSISKFAMVDDENQTSDVNLDRNVEEWLDAVKNDNLDLCKLKLSTDSTLLNAVDGQLMTALHWASDRGSSKVMNWLLRDVGADRGVVNLRDVDGQTPLHYASSCDNVDLASLLIQFGADVNVLDNDGNLAYDVATSSTMRNVLSSGSLS